MVDLGLTESHGLELIKDIRSQHNPVPIVVFTMFEESTYALRALKAGATVAATRSASQPRTTATRCSAHQRPIRRKPRSDVAS